MDGSDHKITLDEDEENIIYKSTTTSSEYIKSKVKKKYRHELQHLLPFRSKKKRTEKEMPIDSASFFEFITFSWLTPLVWRSYKKGLKPNDVYNCSDFDSSQTNYLRMLNIWDAECHRKGLHNASLQSVIHRFIKTRLIFCSLFYLICLLMGYLSSIYFLKKLLDHIEDDSESRTQGVRWVVALFLCELGRALTFAVMYGISIRTATRTAGALNSLLYKKLFTSRSVNKAIGETVNLFAIDINKVFLVVYSLPLVLGGPVVITVTIGYTLWLLGGFAVVGVVIFALIFALQYVITKTQTKYRKRAVENSDKRLSSVTELLTYIKLIKLYAWEQFFRDSITEFRIKEKQLLERFQYLQCLSTSLALVTPLVATIATILSYTLARQGDMTASTAFTLVMVYYVAGHSIRSLPICLRDIINGQISIKRIEKVLQFDDKENYISLVSTLSNAIELKKATIAWDSYSPSAKNSALTTGQSSNENIVQRSSTLTSTCLFDLNLDIPKAKHIGVIGCVGSGKTALLRSLLGQMRLISGRVGVKGSVAYVSQDPWIMNASVKDNIVFGYGFDNKRYYEAINCCSLSHDISVLSAFDGTEIGERGVNLSGGQKQRICLARAYFADKDIYLLDDPLSAVDLNVGQHIFEECIKKGLKEKTVLLVTHKEEHLERMDMVIFMRDGRVVNTGAHNHLYNSDEEYKQLIDSSKVESNEIQEFSQPKTDTELNDIDIRFSSPDWSDVKPLPLDDTDNEISISYAIDCDLRETAETNHVLNSGRLISDEKIGIGNISLDIFKAYLTAGGGIHIFSFVILWLGIQSIASSFSNWWLGYWIAQGNGNFSHTGADRPEGHDIILNNPDLKFYQTVYGISIAVILCSTLALGYMFTKFCLRASSHFHDEVFHKVLKSPMSFFDTIPIGRILNIFSHDMDEMDSQVPQALDGFMQRSVIIVCNIFLIIVIFPWILIPFSALLLVFWLVYNMFRGSMRDLKRLESGLRSPIYSHITETLEGISIIKSFNKQKQFDHKFYQLIDSHSSVNLLYYCSMRWLSTRMDILCILVTLLASIFAVCGKQTVGTAFAGLALVLSMQLSGLLQYVLRLGVEVETRFTSVERIHSYIKTLKPEKDIKNSNNSALNDWPTRGRISFRDVTMRYRPGLPLALKDITFDISSHEKIGIIGRTGAGKSSITSVLFRLVDVNSGSVHIDGIDISTVPLDYLRSRISIIPQDPVLFRGSLRKNLDPFHEYETQAIMEALECVQMRQKVNNLKNGINNSVNESAASFSSGERQLLCLARALLRKTKILILDEAVVHLDGEMQNIIENTLMNALKDCTVIKIAHQLSTIQDCHRVMVLSDGKVVEFDKPSVLASNPESFYSKLIQTNQQNF